MRELNAEQEKRIKEILADMSGCNFDEVDKESRIKEDLGFDSLDDVEAIMELEKEFDCEIPDSKAETIFVVKDYFRVLAEIIN